MEKLKSEILSNFKDLTFVEDTHKYFWKGNPIKCSASAIIDKFKNPFPKEAISYGVAKKRGVTQRQILKEWDDKKNKAIKIGNKTHLFGELYTFNRNLRPKSSYEDAVVKFWNDLPSFIVPALTEVQMFHKDFLFAGTADILLYNLNTKKYLILDYKTNGELFKHHQNNTLQGDFNFLVDTNFNKYQIQLSLYQMLFEQTGFKVSYRKIVWLKPDGTYALYDTEDYRDVLNNYLINNKL